MIQIIKDALREARLNKDRILKGELEVILASMNKLVKESKTPPTDKDFLGVLRKAIKDLNTSKADFVRGNRADLVEECDIRISFLEKLLPPQMSEQEISTFISSKLTELNIEPLVANRKQIIGTVMPLLKGSADGGLITSTINKLLV